MESLKEYPSAKLWQRLRLEIQAADKPAPVGIDREFYLDLAEPIVRTAAKWQNESGAIIDPFIGRETVTCTARFVGALGQLIKAGRCHDLTEACIKGYEADLERLDDVEHAPEFWVKELMYAHEALKDKVQTQQREQWELVWKNHKPRQSYISSVKKLTNNYLVFAAAGEFFKQQQGLNGDGELIEEAISQLLQDFTELGMYRDPNDPITYDLVTKQQLDLIRSYGYSGQHAERIKEICRRGAITSLLCQSPTGQMPYGGRSNQFHLVEAHFVCLCESQAKLYKQAGDPLTAGIFKRAARKAAWSVKSWIADMEPFRHLKQGFDPELMHGIDPYGFYAVYSLLAASLLGTAYHLANETIDEVITPAETGGYVLELWPAFHKVFATCGGYHVEVDTRADHHYDATGLGRIHRDGVRGEASISASIPSSPRYKIIEKYKPLRNLALGPAWIDSNDDERRLADFEEEIENVTTNVIAETPLGLEFEIVYQGDFGQCRKITEKYRLSQAGLSYEVTLDDPSLRPFILVPLIKTDGMKESRITIEDGEVSVEYRGCRYRIVAPESANVILSDNKPAANRNAAYLTAIIQTNRIEKIIIERQATGTTKNRQQAIGTATTGTTNDKGNNRQ